MYDDDLPAAHEAEMTLDTLRTLPEGRYRMRVTADDPSLQFPPGFSFRQSGKLFVLFPDERENQKAMGVVVSPSQPVSVWRFDEAPQELRELSTFGGDEDWLAELPPSFDDDTPDWLYRLAASAGGDLILHNHPSKPGWKICIVAHA